MFCTIIYQGLQNNMVLVELGQLKYLKILTITLVVRSLDTQKVVAKEREQTIYEKSLSCSKDKFFSRCGTKKESYIAIQRFHDHM